MSEPETKTRRFFRGLLAVFLVAQGINHFVLDDFFVRAMPPWLPAPLLLVYVSGVAEVVLGIGLFVSRTRRLAAWGIVALLLAVFPANIQMALHPEQWPEVSATVLWARLPFQAVFVYWVWACALRVKPPTAEQRR